jgi:hypothetical protein
MEQFDNPLAAEGLELNEMKLQTPSFADGHPIRTGTPASPKRPESL